MGQSKGGGYTQKPTLPPNILELLNSLVGQSQANTQQAAQGYSQFLPGGGGGQAIQNEAQRQYQQNTIPSILNAFGSGNKGSSALNQALASSAADLNSSLASHLAGMQLNASQGLGSLGLSQQQMATQTPQFAYFGNQQPLWKRAISGGAKGALSGGAAGAALGPAGAGIGAGAGGLLGGLYGAFS